VGDIFEAIAAPVRRAILDELTDRDGQTLFELCTRLAMKHEYGLSRQGISQHLEVLESAGLVFSVRQGRYKFHYMRAEPLRQIVVRWPGKRWRKDTENEDRADQHLRRRPAKGTRVLHGKTGLHQKAEIPLGEARWLTVVAPGQPEGPELLLEPDAHPAVGPFKKALVEE